MKNIFKYTLAMIVSAAFLVGCKTEGKLTDKQLKALESVQSLKTATQEQSKALEDMIKGINFKNIVEKKLCASGDKKNDQACITKLSEYFNNPQKRDALNRKILDDLKAANEDNIGAQELVRIIRETLAKSNDKLLSAKTMFDAGVDALTKCVVHDFKFNVVQKVEPTPAPVPSVDGKPVTGSPEAPKEPAMTPPPAAPSMPTYKSCLANVLKQPADTVFFGNEKPAVMEHKPVDGKPENK